MVRISTRWVAAYTCWFCWLGQASYGEDLKAPEWKAPDSPPLYQGENSGTTSGSYLDAHVGFGASQPTENGTPGNIYDFGLGMTFGAARGPWSRYEFGFDLRYGNGGYKLSRTPSIKVEYGPYYAAVAKFAYGYSIGKQTYLVWGVGAGPAFTSFSAESNGIEVKSEDTVSALLFEVRGSLIVTTDQGFQFLPGIRYSHLGGNVDSVKVGGVKVNSSDYQVNTNAWQLVLTTRFPF